MGKTWNAKKTRIKNFAIAPILVKRREFVANV